MTDTVTIAIPYYQCPDLVSRAVLSALDQTHESVRVLVVGDGDTPPLNHIGDPRLLVYTVPTNHGAPFVQQLMLLATPDAWYAPLGADDWLDADHIEHLLDQKPAYAAVTKELWWHTKPDGTPDRVFNGGTYEVGTWRSDFLRSIGGYGYQERDCQDNLIQALLSRTVGKVTNTKPTYHRYKRPGSLTMAKSTGNGSPARLAIYARNDEICKQSVAIWNDLADKSVDARLRAIGKHRAKLVPAELRREMNKHVRALRALIEEQDHLLAGS